MLSLIKGGFMFTGIIQAIVAIKAIDKQPGLWRFAMDFPLALRENLQHGASVAHNGVCLTVSAQESGIIFFDVMQETLSVTNLANCQAGDMLNVERAMRYGDEVGGHILSGHVQFNAKLGWQIYEFGSHGFLQEESLLL